MAIKLLKPHMHMIGKINLADVIKNRATHAGRPRIAMGTKRKLFKTPIRIKRGT